MCHFVVIELQDGNLTHSVFFYTHRFSVVHPQYAYETFSPASNMLLIWLYM